MSTPSEFNPHSLFFSIDVETDGPYHNMLSFGIVAYDHTGKELDTFSAVISPVVEGVPGTIDWLKKQVISKPDGTSTNAYTNATDNGEDPHVVMQRATCWCMDTIAKNGCTTGYLVCFPSAFDGFWWTTYCNRYNVNGHDNFLKRFPKARADPAKTTYRDPFGFNHYDGQTFAVAKLGLKDRMTLKKLRSMFFTTEEIDEFDKCAHDALVDARNQGQLFFRIAFFAIRLDV
jgi:hypothetical protein